LPLRQAQGGAYGEDYIYQRNSSWNVPYTFSGKEKDAETGYSYFGARYYDSETSIFISVDSMSDERLGLSPYNYCQLNPVMLIDPTGMLDTDFGVKANGEVKQIGETNNEPDRLYAINDDGTKKSENHVTVKDKRLLPSLTKTDPSKKEGDYWGGKVRKYKYDRKTKKETYQDEYKNMLQLYYGTTESSSDAKKVFKFAAKNSTVEWGLGKNNSGLWVVGTLKADGQAPTFEGISGFKFENILFYAHSHGGKNPDYDFVPSINDVNSARNLKRINPTSQSWLYTPQNLRRLWIDLNNY